MFVKKLIVRLALIILIVGIFSAAAVLAAPGINKQLSYQGTLKSGGINVADGDFDIIFRIYDAATDGNLLWTGTHTTANGNPVTLTNGVFNAFLGSGTGNAFTLDFNTDTLYLGITVSTDSEMTPRQRFVASVYAFNADTVDGIGFATTTISTGDILYASASNLLQRLAPGDDGQVLKLNSGLPSWSTDLQGSGGGSGLFATTTDSLVVYLVDTNDVLVIGGNATTTTGNILEIVGNALFGGNGIFTNTLTAYNTITAPIFTATSTTATSTLPYLAVSNNSSLGTVIDGTWQGSTVGVAYGGTGSTTPTNFLFGDGLGNLISTSTIAQNYIDAALARTSNILTLSNWFATTTHSLISSLPSLSITESQISDLQSYLTLANWFATTSAPQLTTLANLATVGTIGTGVWQGTALTDTYIDNNLTISGGTINNTPIGATTPSTGVFTSATSTNFGLNSETFTDLTGTGLQNSSGVLTLNATGDWTGTFDGQEGSYYLDASNLTNFGTPFYTFFNATTTTALAEGINLYFTNSRVDDRINASSTIPDAGGSAYGDLLSWSGSLWETRATSTLAAAFSDTTGTLTVSRGGTGLTTFGGNNTILYTSSADTLTSNANFVFDGTNLGVGTSSPYAKLSVWGDGTGGATAFTVVDSASTTLFTVLDNGNVGIGTTSPGSKLDIVGDVNITADYNIGGTQVLSSTALGSGVVSSSLTNLGSLTGLTMSGNISVLQGNQIRFSGGSGNNYIEGNVSNTGRLGIFTENIERITILLGGSVGIGDITPDGKLEVRQTAAADIFNLYDNTTNVFTVLDGGNVGIGNSSPTYALDVTGLGRFTGLVDASHFVATSTTATSTFAGGLTIETSGFVYDFSSGNVGIGVANSADKLDVAGNVRVDRIILDRGVQSSYIQKGESGTNKGMSFYTVDAHRMIITEGGNVGIGETVPGSKLSVSGGASIGSGYDTTAAPSNGLIIEGNVGIGTSTPDNALTLVGSTVSDVFDFSITSNDALIKLGENQQGPHGIYFGDDGGVAAQIMYHTGSNLLSFEAGTTTVANLDTTDYLTIDFDTGNVGIGTVNPDEVTHIDKAVDGSSVLLLLENSQANAGGSTNETAEIRFGFGGNNDVARIVAAKRNDYSSTANEDSYLQMFVDVDGTATKVAQFRSDGLIFDTDKQIIFGGTAGGAGNTGIWYKDLGGTNRNALIFPGNNEVVLSNRGANGIVKIKANTSTGGSGGEVTVATYEDDKITFLTSGGNVGIGTTSPTALLGLQGAIGVNSSHLYLAADGNVGIGTTVPNEKFHVIANNIQFKLEDDSGNFSTMGSNNSQLIIDVDPNNAVASTDLLFKLDGVEVARFLEGGNFGVGTLTPDEFVHFRKSVDGVLVGLLIENSQANTNASINETAEIRFGFGGDNDVARIVAGKIDDYDGPASEDKSFLAFYTDVSSTATEQLRIDDVGNVGIGETAPAFKLEIGGGDVNTTGGGYRDAGTCVAGTCASDIALKQNIQLLDGSLERILKLTPSTFEFIDPQYGATTTNYGLVAQEVEPIFPEWVVVRDDGYKSIRYGLNIQMHMLRAVQEQQAQIQALQIGADLQGNVNGPSTALKTSFENLEVIDATFGGNIIVRGHTIFNEDTVGQAKILAGDSEVRVQFTEEYQYQTIIIVTPNNRVDGEYWIRDKTTGGFIIQLSSMQESDIIFDWHAFGAESGKIYVSDGSTQLFTANGTVQDINIVVTDSSSTSGVLPESDTEAPVITVNGNNPAEILVGASYSDLGATVTDNINDNLGIHTFVDGVQVSQIQLDTSISTTYIIRYEATDQADNTGTAERLVIVGTNHESPNNPSDSTGQARIMNNKLGEDTPADSTSNPEESDDNPETQPSVDDNKASTTPEISGTPTDLPTNFELSTSEGVGTTTSGTDIATNESGGS